jgi:pimeloyl-ACP methyl ester carboxylesterase
MPITLPGLGTPPPSPTSFRKTDLATWVLETLTAEGVERFALIGHDWGATVAAHVASKLPEAVTALVIEEETLPGTAVDLAPPGVEHYPLWHGPFNRVPQLAEQLVPGNEAAYYGTFLTQSAGPTGLDTETLRNYVTAYSSEGVLDAGLGYYRTREADIADTRQLHIHPIKTPTLAIGGRFAMSASVEAGMRLLATDVTGVILERSGHYPAEQEPERTAETIASFLARHNNWRASDGEVPGTPLPLDDRE